MDRPCLEAVNRLADAARAADGVAPLSEATLLSLAAPSADGQLHGYVEGESGLDAYSHLRLEDDGTAWAEIVVHPQARRRGLGTRFLEFVRDQNPAVRVWAHGDLPAARALASRLGLQVVRELLVLSRDVREGDETDPSLPEGVRHRTFVPGTDETALLEANAAAFVHHPEQGALDQAGLDERMAQPWFDPEGVILLEDDDPSRLVGFHWTKIDPPGGDVGEVYVVGVHPDCQGRGLAGPLTGLGLAHLARRGVREVELYVEGDNTPALATYERAGFARKALHVMYSHEVHPSVQG